MQTGTSIINGVNHPLTFQRKPLLTNQISDPWNNPVLNWPISNSEWPITQATDRSVSFIPNQLNDPTRPTHVRSSIPPQLHRMGAGVGVGVWACTSPLCVCLCVSICRPTGVPSSDRYTRRREGRYSWQDKYGHFTRAGNIQYAVNAVHGHLLFK